jgi:hypothetical protein
MSGECKGWSTWKRFKRAGVVDEHIDFSDNKVVVDNVLGRTQDTIGKCFAIDAAVAYTLSKAGPDANLTVQDMVNEYTRTAAAMMNGKVGYGSVYKTGHLDGEHYTSCGHDEVEAVLVSLHAPTLNDDGYIEIRSTGWSRAPSMEEFLGENRAPENVKALAVLRMREAHPYTDDWLNENRSNQTFVSGDSPEGIDYDGCNVRLVDVMMSEHMKPLKEWIEGHFNCKNWKFGTGGMDMNGSVNYEWQNLAGASNAKSTRGVCGWTLDGSDRYCTYHDAYETTEDDWWMVTKKGKTDDFIKVWNGARCAQYWNSDMFPEDGEWYHGRQVIQWSDVRRGIANGIDEAEVKRQIKKALNRMTKRSRNIVSLTKGEMGDGAPEDRTYRWKDWSWLAVIQEAVAQTSKKNRKEGDVVRGWKYTKISSKTSYGHEIAEFEWQPDGEVCTYTVMVKPHGGYSYYTSQNALPFRFKTLEDAVKFNKMLPMVAGKVGASGFHRIWNKVTGKEADIDCDRLFVNPIDHADGMKMEMSKDPEDLPSPTEIVQKVFFGLPNEYGPAIEHLEGDPFKDFKVKVTEGVTQ